MGGKQSVLDICIYDDILVPYWVIFLGMAFSTAMIILVSSDNANFFDKLYDKSGLKKISDICCQCNNCCKKNKNKSRSRRKKYPSMIEISASSELKKYLEITALMGYFHKKRLISNNNDMYVIIPRKVYVSMHPSNNYN